MQIQRGLMHACIPDHWADPKGRKRARADADVAGPAVARV